MVGELEIKTKNIGSTKQGRQNLWKVTVNVSSQRPFDILGNMEKQVSFKLKRRLGAG